MNPVIARRGSPLALTTDGTSTTVMLGEMQRLWTNEGSLSGLRGAVTKRSHDGWIQGGAATTFGMAVATVSPFLGDAFGNPGGINSNFFEGPGSEHPGGANLSHADASVKFYSENADPVLIMALGTRGGGEVGEQSGRNASVFRIFSP